MWKVLTLKFSLLFSHFGPGRNIMEQESDQAMSGSGIVPPSRRSRNRKHRQGVVEPPIPDFEDDFDEFGHFESADPMEQSEAQPLPDSLAHSNPWASAFSSQFPGFKGQVSPGGTPLPTDYNQPEQNDMYYGGTQHGQQRGSPSAYYGSPGMTQNYGHANTHYSYSPEQRSTGRLNPSPAVLDLEKDVLESAQAIRDLSSSYGSQNRSKPPIYPHSSSGQYSPSSAHQGLRVGGRPLSGGDAARMSPTRYEEQPPPRPPPPVMMEEPIQARERRDVHSELPISTAAPYVPVEQPGQASPQGSQKEQAWYMHSAGSPQTVPQEPRARAPTPTGDVLSLKKQIMNLTEENLRLVQELADMQKELKEQEEKYNAVKAQQESQLEDMRQAGHNALAMVVEEYKELCRTSVLQQQEETMQKAKEILVKEAETLRQAIDDQEHNLKIDLEADRLKNEERLKQALEEARKDQQEIFSVDMDKERDKRWEAISKALMEERDNSRKAVEAAVQEERERGRKMLDNEREKLLQVVEEETWQSRKALHEGINEERRRSRAALERALIEERRNSREAIQHALTIVRSNVHTYIRDQRKADALLRQRHLVALDVFLGGAKQQLQVLSDEVKAMAGMEDETTLLKDEIAEYEAKAEQLQEEEKELLQKLEAEEEQLAALEKQKFQEREKRSSPAKELSPEKESAKEPNEQEVKDSSPLQEDSTNLFLKEDTVSKEEDKDVDSFEERQPLQHAEGDAKLEGTTEPGNVEVIDDEIVGERSEEIEDEPQDRTSKSSLGSEI